MAEDQKDTDTQDLSNPEDAPEEEDDDASAEEESSEDDDVEQADDESEKPRLLAGKYKTPEQLEAAYLEIQRFVGNRAELEEKARRYDADVKARARSEGSRTVKMPKLTEYVDKNGEIDTEAYDKDMEKWQRTQSAVQSSEAERISREQTDLERVEKDFPYIGASKRASNMVMSMYYSGQADSIYEAALIYDEERREIEAKGKKNGAALEQRERSKKMRGNTERAGTRVGSGGEGGEMSVERFRKLTPEQQKAYINGKFDSGDWKAGSAT